MALWATARKSPISLRHGQAVALSCPAAAHGKNDLGIFQKNKVSSYFVYKLFIEEPIDNSELRWYTAFSTQG